MFVLNANDHHELAVVIQSWVKKSNRLNRQGQSYLYFTMPQVAIASQIKDFLRNASIGQNYISYCISADRTCLEIGMFKIIVERDLHSKPIEICCSFR